MNVSLQSLIPANGYTAVTDRLTPIQAAYGGEALEAWPNNTCGHCGAVQESQGIGTEATLAEHIANIVDGVPRTAARAP